MPTINPQNGTAIGGGYFTSPQRLFRRLYLDIYPLSFGPGTLLHAYFRNEIGDDESIMHGFQNSYAFHLVRYPTERYVARMTYTLQTGTPGGSISVNCQLAWFHEA
jgi:hypothetical protein